ncbi:sulfotransferase domain-containing protein [Mesobacterium pallidum]|uniref:sulfotransferase domain-containing protein n=1 Tax=Mesobacterium pallidum TaxID=2872037 RepID=UPI001EE370E6|nr:sulfotransferase domain-containing protein [Mesobacterium pallidum]
MTDRPHYLGPLTDSRRWDHVAIRPGDVIVVTPPKSGTTWMQTMIALLLSGDPQVETDLPIRAPWVDIRSRDIAEVTARLEAMDHRRSMKSHTPLDGLPLDEGAQYICVFRHPLDAHLSFRRHVRNLPLDVFEPWYPADDPAKTFAHFLGGSADGPECDATPLAHILRHYTAARALADRPNVALFHYADMQRDLAGAFDRLAAILGVAHPAPVMAQLVEAAGFENMKRNAARFAPAGGKGFFKSDAGFFDSGTSGKWRAALSDEEISAYDAIMAAELTPEDRLWLETGSGPF